MQKKSKKSTGLPRQRLPRERMLWEETIIPSPNSINLEQTVESEFLHRFDAGKPHVAEMFHENSKLTPYSTLRIPEDDQKLEEVRTWYFSTAYAVKDKDIDPKKTQDLRINIKDLPEFLVCLLETFRQSETMTNLLYGLDLCLLYDQKLYKLLAGTDYLWLDREYSNIEIEKVKAAILGVHQAILTKTTALIFIVGCPWRYMMLFGPRGYRHTLIDTGRLLAYLENKATANKLHFTIAQNFYDVQVDRFLFIDGVERSALAILALEGEES